MPQTFPISAPTSALTFADLILEVASKTGLAYYGADGQGQPQVPVNVQDLFVCQKAVNNAIRMFISDGPKPNGWNWIKPVAQIDLWPVIAADPTGASGYITSGGYNATTNEHTLILNLPATASSTSASTAVFYPTMELRTIYLGGNPPAGTPGWSTPVSSTNTVAASTIGAAFTIVDYLSPTSINVYGQVPSSTFASTAPSSTSWSMPCTGDYTMPADFSGQYAGEITYVANTNRGAVLHWTDEGSIRQRRQNYNIESGTPYEAAVRLMPTPSIAPLTFAPSRRRWELMTWRISSEFLHVVFPYVLSFNNLVNLTDSPPCPFTFDEALKAACRAQIEKDLTDALGLDWQYYKSNALLQAYQVDAMSAPKRLGYFGNPSGRTGSISDFRNYWYQRPTVQVFGR